MDGRRRILTARIATLGLALAVSACATPTLAPCDAGAPLVAWIVDYGWHTEIIVPAAQIDGALVPVRALFPAAVTLSFGFGKQSFMTLADPGLLDFVDGTIPGPATVRIISLRAAPATLYRSPVIQLPLAPAEWADLQGFLWRALAHAPDGSLVPVAAAPGNPDPGRFFAATAGYSLAYTCNAWTVDALHRAGLAVDTNVVFSGGAMRETARINGACRPPA